ncbi:hypothetical protein [Simplicispira hankyongi]|nr:hypothetical protein [Simplicispira hankyongi]
MDIFRDFFLAPEWMANWVEMSFSPPSTRAVSGWYFVATQSFSTKPIRSTVVTTVNVPGAVFAGVIFVVLGLVALAILLQGKVTQKATQFWLVGLLFAIPAAVVFVRWTVLASQ